MQQSNVVTLSDLPKLVNHLVTPAAKDAPADKSKLQTLNKELSALKPQLRQAHIEHEALQAKLKTLKAKLVHLPGNARLLKEQDELVELVVDAQANHADLSETAMRIRREIDAMVIADERNRLLELANERVEQMVLPVEDQLEKALLLSDMARGLQRRELSKRKYYTMLLDRTYRRSPNGDGGGSTNPEMDDGAINRLEEMRLQLEEITVLRMAIEIIFDRVIDDLPENAPFVPKLLSYDDATAEQRYAEYDAQRNAKRNAETDTINEGHRGITAMERAIYKPRQFARKSADPETSDSLPAI